MTVRFRGEYQQRVDDKCRLSIPAGYRQALEQHGDPRLIVVRAVSGPCLQVYTAKEWEAVEDRIRALPQSDPTVIKLMRFQVAGNQLLEPDSHGRVVLPPTLRAHAGIGPSTEVVIASQIFKFEIWAKDRWEAELVRCTDDLPNWAPDLARLGL